MQGKLFQFVDLFCASKEAWEALREDWFHLDEYLDRSNDNPHDRFECHTLLLYFTECLLLETLSFLGQRASEVNTLQIPQV